MQPDHPVSGRPWTQDEIDAAVAAYLGMLEAQVNGRPYVKREVVRDLQARFPHRSKSSIEFKFQNISAILMEHEEDRIEGYVPLYNYQAELQRAVLVRLAPGTRIAESLAAYETSAIPAPSAAPLATSDVLVSTPASRAPRNQSSVHLTGSSTGALREFKNHHLGTAGELWVIDLEREQLVRDGRADLAERVRWVAREEGDSAGYDVESYRRDGSVRLIEVKTTNKGLRSPFYITRWEVETSRRNQEHYSLYRVHGFARDPRIYVLDGSVEERARLEPKVYLGIPL